MPFARGQGSLPQASRSAASASEGRRVFASTHSRATQSVIAPA